ncbi:MAG: riboflavin synthase [Solirubrobacterales bacterium]
MFTGLVAEMGTIAEIERGEEGARLRIDAELASELAAGDSVAVSGVCLTAVEPGGGSFSADVMNQTLDLSALGDLESGGLVNLEPALRASDRLGGHIVQGHVDGTAVVESVTEDGFARRVRFALPADLARYVIVQGSISLDGVSLTISALDGLSAEVSLIPETLEQTTLGTAAPGRRLNVEVDLMARYAERILGPLQPLQTSTTDGG